MPEPKQAHRGGLARGFCLYVCVFWLIRLGLQGVFDVTPHLTIVYGWAALGPVG